MKKWKELSKRTQDILTYIITFSVCATVWILMGVFLMGLDIMFVLKHSAIGMGIGLPLGFVIGHIIKLLRKPLSKVLSWVLESLEGIYYFLYSYWHIVLMMAGSMFLVIYGWYVIDDVVVATVGVLLPIIGGICFMRRGCCVQY